MKKTKNGGFLESNLLYIFWFVAHVFVVWFMFGFGRKEVLFIVAGLYSISVAIAFSPIGEWLLCIFEDAQKISTSQDKNYLEPIFDEVYEQVKKKTPSVSRKIRLKIVNAMYINAFAMGKHTIAITRGAMETLSEDELKGLLAHEFAHIINGDTKAVLLQLIGNMFFTFAVDSFRKAFALIIILLGDWGFIIELFSTSVYAYG